MAQCRDTYLKGIPKRRDATVSYIIWGQYHLKGCRFYANKNERTPII